MYLVDKYVGWLLKLAKGNRSVVKRLMGLVVGGTLFLVIIAWPIMCAAEWLAGLVPLASPAWLDTVVGVLALVAGFALMGWAVWSQWVIGGGTPNPAVPTQRLMVVGAYRVCRNPLQLSVMVYYLGIGALLADTVVGVIMFLIAYCLGAPYHKWVEEKELVARFGADYEEYRRNTPFMIPRLWN